MQTTVVGQNQAQIQYIGLPGATQECVSALHSLVESQPKPSAVRLITCRRDSEDAIREHAFLIEQPLGELVCIPSGFASGYGGEAPNGLSFALALLRSLSIPISEVEVERETLDRVDSGQLTDADVEMILQGKSRRRWADYITDEHSDEAKSGELWQRLEPTLPLGVIHPTLNDLAASFWDDPDRSIVSAFRRLEDEVRALSGLKLSSQKLFSKAFVRDDSVLLWPGMDLGEQKARGQMFTSAFGALRNRRSHSEALEETSSDRLCEFLSVNMLFRLLAGVSRRPEVTKVAR